MKLYLDTADVEAIGKAHATGLLDGVTTNPTSIARAGQGFQEVVKAICEITSNPVSAEATAETAGELIRQAREIASWAPNLVVKIPMTEDGLRAVSCLEQEHNVRTNVTMIFSSTQALLAMKAGASYVSIVLSRLDACANESDVLVKDSVTLKQNYGFTSQIIAGSLKTQNHLLSCLRAGVDIATMPPDLFFQMFKHPLTDLGIAQFLKDWENVPQ